MLYGVAVRQFRAFFEKRVLHGRVPSARVGVLVSWCGMRGLVTLATALALPPEFPGRHVIVLSAFTVVLGTLILQGFTMRPLINLLRIAPDASLDEDVSRARQAMVDAALEALAGVSGEGAAALRAEYGATHAASVDRSRPTTAYDELRTQAIAAERRLLNQWRSQGRIHDDAFHLLEDELDRAELHVASFGTTWLDR
jgi:monovalent cation/hydrogen antiporter